MTSYLAFYLTHGLLALTERRNYAALFLFVVLNLWFVGLRYEVGFDWVVYKDQFEYFSSLSIREFVGALPFWQQYYKHELGFLVLSYLASQSLPGYEFFHLLIFTFFLYSVFSLAKAVGSKNLIASFLLIHLYLLFTLEFSTLRQVVAISIFNIGVRKFLTGDVVRAYAWMFAAPFFQLSAIMYLVIFIAASGSPLRVWAYVLPLLFLAVVLSLVGFAELPLVPALGSVGAKLIWYFELREVHPNRLEQVFFITFYLIIAAWSFLNLRKTPRNVGFPRANRIIVRMMMIMAVTALVFFGITVIRNRIMYELVILASVMAFTRRESSSIYLRPVLLGWGAIFLTASLVKPTSLAYVPYQNYVVHQVLALESDGWERQKRLEALIASR